MTAAKSATASKTDALKEARVRKTTTRSRKSTAAKPKPPVTKPIEPAPTANGYLSTIASSYAALDGQKHTPEREAFYQLVTEARHAGTPAKAIAEAVGLSVVRVYKIQKAVEAQ